MKELKGLNKDKLKRQLQGRDKFFNSLSYGSFKDCSGCLNYATGTGKTITSLLIVDKYLKQNPNANVLIIVPNEFLVKQWEEEIDKIFYKYEIGNKIKIFTIDYIITNNLVIHCNLLILDELHMFYTPKRIKIIKKEYIIYQDILALTATYEDPSGIFKEIEHLVPRIDVIDEQEALEKGYVTPYIEFNFGVDFTEEEQKVHDKYSEIIKDLLPKFGKGGLDLVQKCLSGGKGRDGTRHTSTDYCRNWAKYNGWRPDLNPSNPDDVYVDSLWNPNVVFGYAIKLMKAIKSRKDLIYSSSSKLDVVVQLLQKFEQTPTIVFSQSTTFADNVYSIIQSLNPDNAVIYHSQVKTQMLPSPKTQKLIKFGKTRLKTRAIQRIKEGKSKHLITSSVLDKGLDVPNLRLGIATSGTQNYNQHKQRKGRTNRIDQKDVTKVALYVNLYIRNSREVAWLKKRQSKSKNRIYWINSIEQISFTPNANNDFKIDDL